MSDIIDELEELKHDQWLCGYEDDVDILSVAIKEIEYLRKRVRQCDPYIECNYTRDTLDILYEAAAKLPCNSMQGVVCAAIQELQYYRGE